MMPLNHIIRKCSAEYKLSRSQEKINHLMYMDDIKRFAKNKKELDTLIHAVRIYCQDIGMEYGIEKCAILVMNNKRHLTDGMELPNQDKIRMHGEKETYKYLGILEADTMKQEEMKEKNFRKNISGEPESYSRQNYIAEILSKKEIPRLSSSFDIRYPF